ncbi:MAG: response regulator transcription factor [Caulobacterales bacterium]
MSSGILHIVDDDPAIGRALVMLASSAGLTAVAHTSAAAFLAVFDPESAGCVVTDARMPGMSGLELLRALRDRGAGVPVIVVTGHGAVSMAVEALKGGAADFIEKPFDDDIFLASVRSALAAAERTAVSRQARASLAAKAAQLSAREREVMDLIVEGLSSPAIAQRLEISVRTVESHRARVMEKMGAQGLADLVRQSIRLQQTD